MATGPIDSDLYYSISNPDNDPITSISVTISLKSVPSGPAGQFYYILEGNLADAASTAFYAGLQPYGQQATQPGIWSNSIDNFSLWNATSTGVVENGSLTTTFTGEGTGGRITNNTLPVQSGYTYTLNVYVANGNLYESTTDVDTGKTTIVGYFPNIDATSLGNLLILSDEWFGDGSPSATSDVVFSDMKINGVSATLASTYSFPTNPGNVVHEYTDNGPMEIVYGSNTATNVISLEGSNVIIDSYGPSILQLTSEYHDITGVTLNGVTGLDLNGQRAIMTAAEYSQFQTFENGAAGIVLTTGGTISSNNSLGSYSAITGNADTVVYANPGSDYSFTPTGDGVSFTLTAGSLAQRLTNITALQFSDYTDIVASTTPPTIGGLVSSAMITELYGAVFGRVPDLAGLAFYESWAQSHPNTSFLQYAQWFLASPEYTGNSAHLYAASAAGDTQFIKDCYQNLLHRAPDAAGLQFYQNYANSLEAGLTTGSAALATEQGLVHANILQFFSQSPEFLTDVSVTAQHPTDATHWLILI